MKGILRIWQWVAPFTLVGSFVAMVSFSTLFLLEREALNSVVRKVESKEIEDPIKQVAYATRLVHLIGDHSMQANFSFFDLGILRHYALSPSLRMMFFGEGMCGYISFLFIDIVGGLGFDARPLQILDGNGLNQHVIVRVDLEEESLFVDPLYGWLYLDDEKRPIQQEVLTKNWEELTQGLEEHGILNYPITHGVRYTNWGRLGRIGDFLKPFCQETFGVEETEEFSLRAKLPNFYVLRLFFCFCVFVPSVWWYRNQFLFGLRHGNE
jgi:hypothetical protein